MKTILRLFCRTNFGFMDEMHNDSRSWNLLTKIMPIKTAVVPIMITRSECLILVIITAQVPVISPPKRVPISKTAPEQS